MRVTTCVLLLAVSGCATREPAVIGSPCPSATHAQCLELARMSHIERERTLQELFAQPAPPLPRYPLPTGAR